MKKLTTFAALFMAATLGVNAAQKPMKAASKREQWGHNHQDKRKRGRTSLWT